MSGPTQKFTNMRMEKTWICGFYNGFIMSIKDIQGAIVGMMASTFEERILGRADVRDVFHVPKVGTIAGCYVTDGKVERGQNARLLRDGIVCHDSKISSCGDLKMMSEKFKAGMNAVSVLKITMISKSAIPLNAIISKRSNPSWNSNMFLLVRYLTRKAVSFSPLFPLCLFRFCGLIRNSE